MAYLDWSKRADVTVVDPHRAGTCVTCGRKCLIKVAGAFQHKVCAEQLIDEAASRVGRSTPPNAGEMPMT